jgi:hypothetical protein
MPVTMNKRQIAAIPSRMPKETLASCRVLKYLIQSVANTTLPTPIENQGFIEPPCAAFETGP